ncbi:tetratricopeptide repeat protein [Candidatus Nitrospira neomarina]|uniref:Tetratricopeptide repeat protein n=1 Tax=Candidatus Nitrospira neomarina TaxID=3020899 RepID=A0AA96GMC4_9BACT|nr:tetratricopeptide repeat protein [Candidatus Nitrospira neomarina]WNM60874.1 tetratricopeptide repeat protein [Candidatus Nitrospira neomarina]
MGYKIKDLGNKTPMVEPAQFLSSKERFLFFVEEHRALVWGGIFLVLAVIVAIVTLIWLNQNNQEHAWELEGQAQTVYLDRPLDDVKKGQENIQKASGMFKEILDQFPGTPSAGVSSFLLGNSMIEEKNYQGAIDVYTSWVKEYGQNQILLGLVQQRLGFAYLLHGNREAALKAFDAVLANPHALNKDQVVFELAKIAEADENIPEAVEQYKKVIQEFPLSPFASEAALRVEVLAPEEAKDLPSSETIEMGGTEKSSPENPKVQDNEEGK